MSVNDCRIIELPKIADPRGNLTFVEGERNIPFTIKRVYYLYDVPGGAVRAGHGHKKLEQFMIAISGSFDVLLDDGFEKRQVHLDRSFYGLYISPMTWREINNFSSGSVCVVMASDYYDIEDYYYNYDEFLAAVKKQLST